MELSAPYATIPVHLAMGHLHPIAPIVLYLCNFSKANVFAASMELSLMGQNVVPVILPA